MAYSIDQKNLRISNALELYTKAPRLKLSLRAAGLSYLFIDLVSSKNFTLETLYLHKCDYQELSELLDDLMEKSCLTYTEKKVLSFRYGLNPEYLRKSCEETAKFIGLETETCRIALITAFKKLRAPSKKKLIKEMFNL